MISLFFFLIKYRVQSILDQPDMFILSDVYRLLIGIGDRVLSSSMKNFVKWDHPGKLISHNYVTYLKIILAGPKYVHFWSRKLLFSRTSIYACISHLYVQNTIQNAIYPIFARVLLTP